MKKYCMLALAVCMANISTNAADAGYKHITGVQISALRQEQVASIKQADLQKLSERLIANLINPSHNDCDLRNTGRFVVREWNQQHERVAPRLNEYQIIHLSDQNIAKLSSYDLKNIDLPTLRKIKSTAFDTNVVQDLLNPQNIQEKAIMTYSYKIPETPSLLNERQIMGLKPQQFKELRCYDLHNIADATIGKLTIEQVNSFPEQSLSYLINPRCFVAIQRNQEQNVVPEQPLLSIEQFNNLELDQLRFFSPEVVDHLPNDYIEMLKDNQKATMYPKCLTPARFAQLANNELQAFTDVQLNSLNLRQIQALNQEQLQLFRLNQLPAKDNNFAQNVSNIPPIRLRALNNDELNRLLFS